MNIQEFLDHGVTIWRDALINEIPILDQLRNDLMIYEEPNENISLHIDDIEKNKITKNLNLIENRVIHSITALTKKKVISFPDYKFIRIQNSPFIQTVPHSDLFYFQRHSEFFQENYLYNKTKNNICQWCHQVLNHNIFHICDSCMGDNNKWNAYTCWIPFMSLDQNLHHQLYWIPDTHKIPNGWIHSFKKELPLSHHDYLPNDLWTTSSHFNLGDIVIFHWKTIHCAKNLNYYPSNRISMDVRFRFECCT